MEILEVVYMCWYVLKNIALTYVLATAGDTAFQMPVNCYKKQRIVPVTTQKE